MAAVVIGTAVFAQNNWYAHRAAKQTHPATATKAEPTGECLFVTYSPGYQGTIYPGDGFTFNEACRVGAGVYFPKSMTAPYAGARIVGLRLGWNDTESTATYEGFLTKGINGEEIATKETTVNFGWNNLFFDEPLVIPEGGEDLFGGFYVDVNTGVCCIPTLFPEKTPNSCYLWHEGDLLPDGGKAWLDLSLEFRPLAVQLIVEDTDGSLAHFALINSVRAEEISTIGTNGTASLSVSNLGTDDIRSIDVATRFGEQTSSMPITLSSVLVAGDTKTISVPVWCFGTGTHAVYISKINDEANNHLQECEVNLIGVPESVAAEYDHRPLIEWFVSENNYKAANYTDEVLMPAYEKYSDRMTLVSQHLDDQFMTGEDDAVKMLLDYVHNDSSEVSVPCVMINRAHYAANIVASANTPAFPVLFPQFAEMLYENVLEHPTFAGIEAEAKLENGKIHVNVSGHIAEGVMPENEPLYLTVYLMEKNVVSDSQLFWDDKEEEAHSGTYTHPNILREKLTPFYGRQLESNSGDFSAEFDTETDPSYNTDNLSVVAFINRGLANGNFSAQVINSTEAPVIDPTGIHNADCGNGIAVESRNGSFHADRGTVEVYTSDGRRVANRRLDAGVYLVKVTADGRSTVRKMFVK